MSYNIIIIGITRTIFTTSHSAICKSKKVCPLRLSQSLLPDGLLQSNMSNSQQSKQSSEQYFYENFPNTGKSIYLLINADSFLMYYVKVKI